MTFFRIYKWNTKLKIIYNILTIILWGFWGIFILNALFGWFSRKYLYPIEHKEIIFAQCDNFGLDKRLVLSLVKVESNFKVNAKSKKGAVGLMQVTPTTAKFIAKELNVVTFDLYNPNDNVTFGCYYLGYLLNKFNDTTLALCAYNAGEGNVIEWLKNSEYSHDGKTLYKIPFKETENYIRKINKAYNKYTKFYKNIVDK